MQQVAPLSDNVHYPTFVAVQSVELHFFLLRGQKVVDDLLVLLFKLALLDQRRQFGPVLHCGGAILHLNHDPVQLCIFDILYGAVVAASVLFLLCLLLLVWFLGGIAVAFVALAVLGIAHTKTDSRVVAEVVGGALLGVFTEIVDECL